MKKKLILVSIERKAMEKYLLTLRQFFHDRIDIIGYYTNQAELPARLDGDLVLYTSQELVSIVRPRISESANILLLRRVLLRSSLEKLKSYPAGTSAVFLDYTAQTAKHLISLVLDCGIRNINFTPAGRDTMPEELRQLLGGANDLLVIAGMGDLIHVAIDEVVDLGWTAIDATVILEICILLDCFDDQIEQRLLQYMRMVTNTNHGILYFLRTITESQCKYETIMELLEDGILVYGRDGIISHCNVALTDMFHLANEQVVNANLVDIALPKALKDNLLARSPVEDKWISSSRGKSSYTLTVYEIRIFSEVEDYVAVIRSADRVQLRSSQVRRYLKETQGFRARYTFDDILGDSPAITACRQTAARIAQTEGTVLITGETGTGKELFAQAIHNASPRRAMPFVAINCAALTPTLLESDLFGYEAGAFTGSKTDGHTGLFVCAHEGTIFLDEIGEIPIELQAKLLRVIEEQEVRPVGSHRTIPIDVRIIAATNQDLYRLVEEQRFRADLFYRLNLFPLRLPALRERSEDILALAENFLHGADPTRRMTERLLETLSHCRWSGNIRELRNCIQYMVNLGGDLLDLELLPPHIGDVLPPAPPTAVLPEENGALPLSQSEKELVGVLLRALVQQPLSRTALANLLSSKNHPVSEYRVRLLLERLRADGLVTYRAGRGGIRLTAKGLILCKQSPV